jgi:CubicO group peptidase (beta-lactamase class C family)
MPPAWLGRHIQTAAEYQAEFNVLEPQGFRLLDLNGYSINGVDHFATVWEQSPGPAWIARHDQTSDQHNQLFDTLPDEGFRPIAVSRYDKGGETRFASLWQQHDGVEVRARHGMTGAQLQAEFNALDGTGFRPVDINGYTVAGQVRFAAIWDRTSMPETLARHGMTPGEYQTTFKHLHDHGYILVRVSGYEDGGQTRYAAIWIKGPSARWQGRHGLDSAAYQAEFNALDARGYRLAKINGHALGGQPQYAAIWHKPYLSANDETFLRQTVTNFMTTHGVPGASVAISHEGRLVFAQGYGVTDPATNVAVTPSHLFRIASVSKPITAVAIFRLIEAGLLNLGDRVFGANGLLGTTFGTPAAPPNPLYGPNIDQITVQHLLEHTSGWAQSQDPMFTQFTWTQAELIDDMLDNQPLTTTPGATYDYLNFGYLLLGRIIEARTGLRYEDAVRQHVLAPCGIVDMHVAGDTLADRRPNEVVYIQQGTWNPYGIRVSRMDAHGGWIASATDLLRFLVRVDGFATRPDILSTGSLATMATATTATTATGGAAGYAKGWAVNAAGNRWHLGDIAGTMAFLVRTSDEFGWAALFNSRNDAQLNLMRSDLDGMFGTIVGRITDWPPIDLF